MKHLILTGLFLVGFQAHALVVDQFSCQFEVKDLDNHTGSKQVQELSVARLPSTISHEAPNIKSTLGSSNITTFLQKDDIKLRADFVFFGGLGGVRRIG